MLPRAPDAGAAASPGRVVDVLRTIQVPATRPTRRGHLSDHPAYTRPSSGPSFSSSLLAACNLISTGAAPLQRPDQGPAALTLRCAARLPPHTTQQQPQHQPGRVSSSRRRRRVRSASGGEARSQPRRSPPEPCFARVSGVGLGV